MASIEPTWFTAFTRQSHLLRLQSPFHLPWLLLQKFLTLQNFLLLTCLGLSSVIVWAHTWLGIPWVANLAAFCGLYSSNYTLWSLSHVSHLLFITLFIFIPLNVSHYSQDSVNLSKLWRARSRHLTDYSRIRPRCNHHHQSSESSFVFSSEKKAAADCLIVRQRAFTQGSIQNTIWTKEMNS